VIATLILAVYRWACERLYHELAPVYEGVAWLVSGGQWSRWRRLALDEVGPGASLVELGCGPGVLLAEAIRAGYAIVGIDRSPDMTAAAVARCRRMGVAANVVRAAAQQLPLPAAACDGVLATFPAPYILEPATLAEAARILRPGGSLVIVGLWVTVQRPVWQRWLPVFFASPGPALRRQVLERLAAAGLQPVLSERVVGWAAVSVVTALKLPVNKP
jgi:ubiquinone/menaquinone biosynthesis C-methylase UbiE